MAWRGQLSKNLKELRILLCQSSPSSSSTRTFIEKNYKDLKTLNPKLPILIRECNGVEPQLWARYDFAVLCADVSQAFVGFMVEMDLGEFANR
ncbi:PREDICTED: NADH dehydrogenase [ubiquinone] 1 alpha subcomplex subunit 2-like isoform X2 [Populus euphratica]|uniref:NADH dehydrogenase [ubiquinone] 1 alpha subcomplex subunit 2-like isoform X2 n=1 Tax=Populus euphratica TaxID=75702 RepID=A0AAJ6T485_POPEU|nr:PREDICTED: NADH dehydrogenase [ubiquinone] 1 alpha subcomplex subunit 2-like isoform X2 [Populus euphratica]